MRKKDAPKKVYGGMGPVTACMTEIRNQDGRWTTIDQIHEFMCRLLRSRGEPVPEDLKKWCSSGIWSLTNKCPEDRCHNLIERKKLRGAFVYRANSLGMKWDGAPLKLISTSPRVTLAKRVAKREK